MFNSMNETICFLKNKAAAAKIVHYQSAREGN
jgi:hypothetical protein